MSKNFMFEKIDLLSKIDLELQHLDSLKTRAFQKFLSKNKREVQKAHAEFDRISAKMDGIFLIRSMITGCASLECYQERDYKLLNERYLDIQVSSSTNQTKRELK